MTCAINDWMLKQYPAFDTELVNKIRELRELQSEIKLSFHNHKQAVIKDKEETRAYLINEINNFLAKDYPDISQKLHQSVLDLQKCIQKHEKNAKKVDEELEKIVHSATIYEDVYKLRDEFKEIKKFMDTFQKKIKKVFEA